jgi:hypothetical protein
MPENVDHHLSLTHYAPSALYIVFYRFLLMNCKYFSLATSHMICRAHVVNNSCDSIFTLYTDLDPKPGCGGANDISVWA